MLLPNSQLFFAIDEGEDNLLLLPKAQIQLITYNRPEGRVAIDLQSQPTIRFAQDEESLLAAIRHGDYAGNFKIVS